MLGHDEPPGGVTWYVWRVIIHAWFRVTVVFHICFYTTERGYCVSEQVFETSTVYLLIPFDRPTFTVIFRGKTCRSVYIIKKNMPLLSSSLPFPRAPQPYTTSHDPEPSSPSAPPRASPPAMPGSAQTAVSLLMSSGLDTYASISRCAVTAYWSVLVTKVPDPCLVGHCHHPYAE